ncbi:crotonase/enoyl-CoA hydratase family protein [Dactylosporangium sp. NPDC051484]|uniref:crotonase/enoyl-CoA hydratase family protein n=1 Tax=Dactylosporangium sp. NPDC051484 TaxID=3154942 RepID=UPI00344F7D46
MTAALDVREVGRVLVVTIDRPVVKNAINGEIADGIARAMDRLDEASHLSVGIVHGAGGCFSAGMDLVAFLAGERPDVPGRGFAGLTRRPPAKPLIASVEGWALAGGFEMVLACDLVVAAESARFGLPEVKRSLVAAGGGALRLAGRVPRAIAMEILLTGAPIGAARAAEFGLVNRIVPDGGALAGALELGEQIAANGPLAVRATKRVVTESRYWTAENEWAEQELIVSDVRSSQDAQEGARAFKERREPVWSGS